MHETLCKDVRAHIDSLDSSGTFHGWCYNIYHGVLPLRVNSENRIIDVSITERNDVATFFKKPELLLCGWSVDLSKFIDCTLEMNINDTWTSILKLKTEKSHMVALQQSSHAQSLFTPYTLPTFVVVDSFYKNPDMIREFALKQDFQENPAFHKGKRCINSAFRFPGLKERFERILGAKIKDWDKYATNGCFQYCVAGEEAVYHCDTQQYAGVLFLTPDAPPQTGTQFFRSKETKRMKVNGLEYSKVFSTGHLDSTQFDTVDVVGNIYNRLVLFDAHLIHAAPLYFGTDINNGRLFQLFFFDLE
jgi:hypothetical protein